MIDGFSLSGQIRRVVFHPILIGLKSHAQFWHWNSIQKASCQTTSKFTLIPMNRKKQLIVTDSNKFWRLVKILMWCKKGFWRNGRWWCNLQALRRHYLHHRYFSSKINQSSPISVYIFNNHLVQRNLMVIKWYCSQLVHHCNIFLMNFTLIVLRDWSRTVK